LDLAPGITYNVVYYLDLANEESGMAVNPASVADVQAFDPGGVSSGLAQDPFTPTNAMAAFGLRQREGEGVMTIDNLAISYDWNGYGSGYPIVTSGTSPSAPVIGLQPVGVTNYSGNPYTMEIAASGIGTAGAGLTYAWYQNGTALGDGPNNVSGSATPALTISSLGSANNGTYYVVVTGAAGGPVQTASTVISVNSSTVAPSFTATNGLSGVAPLEPAPSTASISEGSSVTFNALAVGTGPMSYQWYFNNGSSTTAQGTGPSLTLTSLTPSQSGAYYVVATGGTGLTSQSSNAVLTVTTPQSVTIGYLRSFLNPTSYQSADTTTLFNITGVVTTATNLTSGDTSSCYIQDSTGGINLFVTDGSDFRPQLGDVVTATGVLSTYVDNFELDVTEGGLYYVDTILSHGAAQPTPIPFAWGYSAPLPGPIATNVEGSVVIITNFGFVGYAPGAVFAGGDYVITNAANPSQSYTVFVSDQDTNYVVGQPIPSHAYSIAGPLVQDDATIGIEFTVYSNLVVNAPASPVTITNLAGAKSGANIVLTWTAVPTTASYSVWYATNVALPFANWTKLATGLTFGTSSGTYTTTPATNAPNFYDVSSP